MKAPNGKVRRMVVEPADNGGFLSRTEREAPPRKPNGPYIETPDEKNVHASVEDLAAHIKKTFPAKGGKPAGKPAGKKKPATPAPPTAASTISNQMLEKC